MKVLISVCPFPLLPSLVRKKLEEYDVVVYDGILEVFGECIEKAETDIVLKNEEFIPQVKNILCDSGLNLREAKKKLTFQDGKKIISFTVFYADGDRPKIGDLFETAKTEVVYA